MFEKKLAQIILKDLEVEPTASQQNAVDILSRFLFDDDQSSLFLLKGYAGTGKTLLVSALVKALKQFRINTELLAPTGRAAKVLSVYTQKQAFTIHKKIYRQQSATDDSGKFVLDYNKRSNTLFIVDEASMISNSLADNSVFGSGRLLDDLIEYVYNGKNCRLMLVGDTAQLPPVNLSISPALDTRMLENYDMKVYSAILSDVVRQTEESGILYNATAIRLHIKNKQVNDFFRIKLDGVDDVKAIKGDELVETISDCYDRYGEEETIIITRSNKRANKFNEGIRQSILWRESELETGDILMVVKNNYFYSQPEENLDFIANGDIARVVKVYKTEELYGFRYASVRLRFIDYGDFEMECKIFLDTLTLEAPSFGEEQNRKLFAAIQEEYLNIRNKKKRWEEIRNNEYFNALQVKFAYSVTCHKAQGGQWKAVFLDHGYLTKEMLSIDYLRWFYTAFTRPREKLFLVNFDKHFLGEEDDF
ncbi:MAG TPA: AAA family ATPase [Prolixibacteraceae bacterium]|nr:AAA family ATPase [Prolixibacteraceae bacterium]